MIHSIKCYATIKIGYANKNSVIKSILKNIKEKQNTKKTPYITRLYLLHGGLGKGTKKLMLVFGW